MNRYETSTPRALVGLAAIGMTALTIGLAIGVPVTYGSARSAAPTEVAIIPSRIDVIAVREQSVATRAGTEAPVKRAGEQG